MTQQEINQAEWDNPRNWGGTKWLTVYFAKDDTRIWVPKAPPAKGKTVNLAHRGGVLWMVGINVGVLLCLILGSCATFAFMYFR